jgi:tetratricopeptide repeat protein 8
MSTPFLRPGTQSQQGTMSLEQALVAPRTASARPMTMSAGRFNRLGTASMLAQSQSGPPVDLARIDLSRYAGRPAMARALFLYALNVAGDARKAVDLALLCVEKHARSDWWWKAALGRAYLRLGMLRECEIMLQRALRDQEMPELYRLLGKVFVRLDQPRAALQTFQRAIGRFPSDPALLLGAARLYSQLFDSQQALALYRRILRYDSSCIEALVAAAAHHFDSGHPETALRIFLRLVQSGVRGTAVFCNIAVCAMQSQQLDLCFRAFLAALRSSSNGPESSDVWFNIGMTACSLGDLAWGYKCFRLAVSTNPGNGSAWNNMAVLEARRGKAMSARAGFDQARQLAAPVFETYWNDAVFAFRAGDMERAYEAVQKALHFAPGHREATELCAQLQKHFSLL